MFRNLGKIRGNILGTRLIIKKREKIRDRKVRLIRMVKIRINE